MLSSYRRHRQSCKGDHEHNTRTSEYDERKKGWKRCECPIFISGTLQGSFKRQNSGQWEWEHVRPVIMSYEAAGVWGDAKPEVSVTQPDTPSAPERITIEKAITAFTADFSETAAENTQKKYRLLLKKLNTFAAARGYVMIDQWNPIDVRELRSSWEVSSQTATKHMSTIKTFFEFCLANEWITRNPARLIKRQRTRDGADKRGGQKLPFSEDELKRMYDACDTKYSKQEIAWSRDIHHHAARGELDRYNRKWTGQDLAFISVSIYTGLRISDVATFRSDRMQPTGEILLRTTKAGTHVYTWVPEWLQEHIRARAQAHGPLIFGEHTTKDTNVITDVWRRKLNKLWDLCGDWTVKPTPHRFRHTFAAFFCNVPV